MSKQSEQSQRLTQLEEIEKNISKALEFAGWYIYYVKRG